MVKMPAGSGFWNSTSPSGSQASGETGRRIWMMRIEAALEELRHAEQEAERSADQDGDGVTLATRTSEYQVKRRMP